MVQQTIRESGYEEALSSGIVITGGSSLLPGMAELAEDIFLKPVRVGAPAYDGPLADVVQDPPICHRDGSARGSSPDPPAGAQGCGAVGFLQGHDASHEGVVPWEFLRSRSVRSERARTPARCRARQLPATLPDGCLCSTRRLLKMSFKMLDSDLDGAVIKVVGIGGGGGNAVNHMVNRGVQGVEFITINTDRQALVASLATKTIQLGDAGPRRRRQSRGRPRGGAGRARRHPCGAGGRQHGVHHRRHGQGHRYRRLAGGRRDRQGTRHPDRRRRHQAVQLRGLAARCGSPMPASTT